MMNDLINRRFGCLLVIQCLGVINHRRRYECYCDCGNTITNVSRDNLICGNTTSCGCSRQKLTLEGKKFGRLLVLNRIKKQGAKKYSLYECLCDCGNKIITRSDTIQKGISCGCFQKEQVTSHGKSNSQVYKTWRSMKYRCYNENNPAYVHYGHRGIKVCDRWLESFENFYADMGDPPSENHSIDRIDNNGDYIPENCRWATWEEQENNKSTNVFLTYKDETKTMAEWCKKLNMPMSTLHNRLKRWSIEKALSTAIRSPKLLEYNGKLGTIEDLSKQFGMDVSTLRKRLKKGWNVEQALTTPTSKK